MAEQKFVVFFVNDERYGIPIERVERILPSQMVTRLPKTPKMLLGIFDLRGETVPAIDMRLRFELEPWQGDSNFVVVGIESGRCAFRVDQVDGIVTLDDEQDIEQSPEVLANKNDAFIQGIGKNGDRLIVLIEPNEIVPKALRGTVLDTQKLVTAA